MRDMEEQREWLDYQNNIHQVNGILASTGPGQGCAAGLIYISRRMAGAREAEHTPTDSKRERCDGRQTILHRIRQQIKGMKKEEGATEDERLEHVTLTMIEPTNKEIIVMANDVLVPDTNVRELCDAGWVSYRLGRALSVA